MKNLCLPLILSISFLTALAAPALAEEQYFAIFMDGRKVGHAAHDRKVDAGNVLTTEKATLSIARMGFPITISLSSTGTETAKGAPLAFEFTLDASLLSSKTSGRVSPDGQLELTQSAMGSEYKDTKPWPKDALLSEGLRLLQIQKGLKEGSRYTAKSFSPESADVLDMTITVGPKKDIDILGRTLPLTRLDIDIKMGDSVLHATEYVDDDFNLQKSVESMAGITVEMVACTQELALAPNDYYELVNRMFIGSPVPIPNAATAKSIAYQVRPVNDANLSFPSSDIQRVTADPNGSVYIGVRTLDMPSGVRFPYKGDDKDILASLQATKYLQSDSPQIKALAKRAVGDAKDAALAVRRIESFVAEYVTNKSLSVGYASALEVAQSRQGDCTEFAVLAAAMCRSVGIPAQVVMGLAYIDDFASVTNSFGGHAWTRAYLDGKWYDFDSAFQSAKLGGFNAAHIALAYGHGNPSDFFQLATTLGNFKITDVKVAP